MIEKIFVFVLVEALLVRPKQRLLFTLASLFLRYLMVPELDICNVLTQRKLPMIQ